MDEEYCPICGRVLDDTTDKHHLVPKSLKGEETINLHRICHDIIHATFTERELATYYHTVERLLDHEQIKKFAKWAKKRPYNYYDKMRMSNRRR